MKYQMMRASQHPLPRLDDIYKDLLLGGKRLRSRLVEQVSVHLEVDEKTTALLTRTVDFIHNASLLHDDLVDHSPQRRNKETAWLKYTPEQAVLAGDYLLAQVLAGLSSYGNLKLIQCTSDIVLQLLEGECIENSLPQDGSVQPKQLDEIHELKTGSLFKWSLRAPFIVQGVMDEMIHQSLETCGSILGKLFQRSDDLLDYNIRNHEGKDILGDLKSGYLNFFWNPLD